MNIQGKVIHIGEVKQITDSFKKRDIVIEHGDNPQYLQNCIFECHQDKVSILDGINIGDDVTIEFNLNGRAWADPKGGTRYFNTLACWKIEKNSTGDMTPKRDSNEEKLKEPEWLEQGDKSGAEDDLPF